MENELTYDELDLFERMILAASFPGSEVEKIAGIKVKLARMKILAKEENDQD